MVLLAAAAFILTACSGLQEDGGEKNIRINLPPIVSAAGNSRALSGDRLPTLKTETRRYRVTVNGIVREGTGSSYEFRLAVGIRATAIIECLNSSGEVIIRAVRDFTVSGGENSIDINLKADGTEIIPASAAGRVTYSYGEADRHGNKNGIPSDPTTYSEGDLFEVKDGSGMTWDHASQTASGFAGWSANPAIEPENGGQAESSPTSGQKYKMPAGGVTLTAQWNKKSYTITYNMNAQGSGNTASQTSINQGSVQALEDYTIDSTTPASVTAGGKNYTFMEWSDGNGNTYAVGRKITNVTGNITLTAQWSDKNVWTVTYEKGNTQATEQNITNWIANDTYTEGISSAITLPTLTATGYRFDGWQITGESNNRGGGTSYTPTASVTATAQWTADTYTLSYNYDGGSQNVAGTASFTVEDTSVTFPTVNNKTGYTFSHWSVNNTNVTGYTGSQLINLVTSGKSLALTAVWTANTYTITVNGNGASSPFTNPFTGNYTVDGSNSTQSTVAVTTASAPANANTMYSGKVFDGWSLTSSGTKLSSNPTVSSILQNGTVSGNTITLYAVWKDAAASVTIGSTETNYATIDEAWTVATPTGVTSTVKLYQDVATTATISGDMTLDLNGKTLSISNYMTIASSASLTLTATSPGTIDCEGVGLTVSGTLTLQDNVTIKKEVTGGTSLSVNVQAGGIFNMHGGEIVGYDGGGTVFVSGENSDNAIFRMTGGTIRNVITSNIIPGAIYISQYAKVYMEAGEITGCSAEYGGGVCIEGAGAEFHMTGGTISNCTATSGKGGAIYNSYATFEMGGSAVVTESNTNNDICLRNGSLITVNSSLTGSNAGRITFSDDISLISDYSTLVGETVLTGSAVSQNYSKFTLTDTNYTIDSSGQVQNK